MSELLSTDVKQLKFTTEQYKVTQAEIDNGDDGLVDEFKLAYEALLFSIRILRQTLGGGSHIDSLRSLITQLITDEEFRSDRFKSIREEFGLSID